MKRILSTLPLRKYITEKNALTIMVSLFTFTMIFISFAKENWWQAIGFALAFSFSIEVIQHRANEKK